MADFELISNDSIRLKQDIQANDLTLRSAKTVSIDVSKHSVQADKISIEAKNTIIKGPGVTEDDPEVRKAIEDVPAMLALYEANKPYKPSLTIGKRILSYDFESADLIKATLLSDNAIVFNGPKMLITDSLIVSGGTVTFINLFEVSCSNSHIKANKIVFESGAVYSDDWHNCYFHANEIVGLQKD